MQHYKCLICPNIATRTFVFIFTKSCAECAILVHNAVTAQRVDVHDERSTFEHATVDTKWAL